MKQLQTLLAMGIALILGNLANAEAVPTKINFQGVLRNSNGQLLSGSYSMTFKLWDAPTGGTAVWTESTSVMVDNGNLSILLGSSAPLTSDLFATEPLYLEITVGSEVLPSRQEIGAVPFALLAEDAQKLAGKPVITAGCSDGEVLTYSSFTGWHCAAAGTIGGTGTVDIIAKFDLPNAIGNSVISEDNAGKVGVGTQTPEAKLHVKNVDPDAVTLISECSANQRQPNALFTTAAGNALNQQGNTVMAVSSHISVGFQATCQITPGADDMAGFIVRQNSAPSPTTDVVSVENNSGSTKFWQVDNTGVTHWSGTAQGSISGNAATASTATTLAAGTHTGQYNFSNASNSYAGNGSGLTNVVSLQSTTPGTQQTGHINITGTMTSSKVVSNGGTFTSTLAVQPLFVFVGASGQTGDYWRCNNDVGTTVASISATGNMKCNDCTAEGVVTAKNTADCWGGQTWKSAGGASTVATMDATGNFGIGTAAPESKWHVARGISATPMVTLENFPNPVALRKWGVDVTDGSGDLIFVATGSGLLYQIKTTRAGVLSVAGGQINTGIGGPNLKLCGGDCSVGGAVTLSAVSPDVTVNGNQTVQNNLGVGTPASGAFKADIAGTCHASSFPTSSDIRLKENIQPLSDVLEKLQKVRGVSFDWNETYEKMGRSTGHREIGVIAQEVEEVFPELVTRWGDKDYRAVDYGRLSAVLIEAVKEQQKTIEGLNGKLEKLENLVQKLLDKKMVEK